MVATWVFCSFFLNTYFSASFGHLSPNRRCIGPNRKTKRKRPRHGRGVSSVDHRTARPCVSGAGVATLEPHPSS